MKKILFFAAVLVAIQAAAQPKIITQAVINTKTTIVSPEENEEEAPSPGPGGEERRIIRIGGDGETKSVTTIKDNMVKTFTETEMARTTVLRDNDKKITTTLMEMMGNKTGFVATDEEQAVMAKRMDSLMQSRTQGNESNALRNNQPQAVTISYVEETKKIAGLQCKKAFLVSTKQNGSKDSNVVWYCPDFKIQGVATTGGMAGFGPFSRTSTLNGLSDLAGFPMSYEMKMNRGRKVTVEVTKIVTNKDIEAATFEIPKDFVIKPMKDLQTGDGRVQIRVGGGPGN